MYKLGQKILWQRARDYLKSNQPQLLGIAGSSGKTMVSRALALALQNQRSLRAAPFSYRSRSSVAQAILGVTKLKANASWMRLLSGSRVREMAEENPSLIVLELGANRPGDMDYFARTLNVSVAVVTNVQSTNLHLFSNIETVAHEQASLISALSGDDTACLNIDDQRIAAMAEHTKAKIVSFGQSAGANIRLVRAERLSHHGFACEITINGAPLELHLRNLIAHHQLANILAALAACEALNANIKQAAARLSNVKPPPGSLRHFAGVGKSHLLDDSYNANPEAMLLSLNTLADLPAKRRIAILGDIKFLGAQTITWHEKIGTKAASIADIVIAVGDDMRGAATAALNSSASASDVHRFENSRDAGKWVSQFLKPEDLVLISGSRPAKMEVTVKRLLANPTRDQSQLVN